MDVYVMVCVNDPDNGVDTGRVCAVTFDYPGERGIAMELELREGHEPVCRLIAPDQIRIGRHTYPIKSYRTWVGNWCWDGMLMDAVEASRLANNLRASGKWDCTMGYVELFDEWDSSDPIRFELVE